LSCLPLGKFTLRFVFLPPNSKTAAAAMELAMASAMPDLKFLLDREGVSAEVLAKFYEAGVLNMRQFAAFASDAEDLRKS